MTYDGVVTRAITNEIRKKLLGGKIQKISQPSKNDIVFNIYSMGKSYKLLVSANNNEARINLTDIKFENPEAPPNFCMILRKHLNQGKIIDIRQIGLDRIVEFSISSIDEMGFDTSKKLIVEIMGKYSNIILTDNDYKIIDSIKRVSPSMSSVRQVLPGLMYERIESEKIDITDEDFTKDILYLDQKLPNSALPNKVFYTYYTGLSPVFGKEICYRAGIDQRITRDLVSEDEKRRLNELLYEVRERIIEDQFSYTSYEDDKKIKEFYAFELEHLNFSSKKYDTMSQAVEEFYLVNRSNDRLKQMQNEYERKINQHIKTVKKKISILHDNLAKSNRLENQKKKGDLLSANIYKIDRGMKEIEVEDFYDNNKSIKISLDPMLNPWENVDKYYKSYKKIKNSIDFAKEDLPKQEDYLFYLEQIRDFVKRSESIEDLEEIRSELISNKIIKKNKKDKSKPKKSKALHYTTKNMSDIYIGKNSKQNDYITLKLANKNDYFFHVKDVPGSHVILKTKKLTDEDILVASFLAAKHSSLYGESKIDVDYTEKKNVNKPKGAKPGMVYYENFKTVTVDMNTNIDNLIESNN